MRRYIILIILMFAGIISQAQSYVVIVNKSNSIETISAKKVSNYFLKKTIKWDSGEKVLPVDLNSKSLTRTSFSKEVHKKSVNSVKSYWQQYVFAGKGTPPVEKHSDQEVINFVRNNTGAIGYISVGADASEVKVVNVQ